MACLFKILHKYSEVILAHWKILTHIILSQLNSITTHLLLIPTNLELPLNKQFNNNSINNLIRLYKISETLEVLTCLVWNIPNSLIHSNLLPLANKMHSILSKQFKLQLKIFKSSTNKRITKFIIKLFLVHPAKKMAFRIRSLAEGIWYATIIDYILINFILIILLFPLREDILV
jgi:hypothetical protein